jgi:DNA-binding beta-propeller fold protein YncE
VLVDRRSFLLLAAAAPLGLRVPAARAGLLGGTPLALVTADLDAHIVAVNAATGRIARRLRTAPGPRSIESGAGTTALVAHTSHGVVSIVDGVALRVRARLGGFSEPRYTAFDRAGRLAYVTDSGLGQVVVVDAGAAKVLARVDLGGPARHVSLSPSGRSLWVALGSKAERVAVIDVRDLRRPRVVTHLRPPFLAHDVGFAPDGRTVWVTSGDARTIAVYDARQRRVRNRLTADAPPQHVTFIGGRAYVASGGDGTLRVQDLTNGAVQHVTRVPVGSYNVQQGFGLVLTPSLERGTLCIVRSNGQLEHELRVARSSHDACFVMAR